MRHCPSDKQFGVLISRCTKNRSALNNFLKIHFTNCALYFTNAVAHFYPRNAIARAGTATVCCHYFYFCIMRILACD